MGVEPYDLLEGKSMVEVFREPTQRLNDSIFMEFNRYEIDHDGWGGFQPIRCGFDGRYEPGVPVQPFFGLGENGIAHPGEELRHQLRESSRAILIPDRRSKREKTASWQRKSGRQERLESERERQKQLKAAREYQATQFAEMAAIQSDIDKIFGTTN